MSIQLGALMNKPKIAKIRVSQTNTNGEIKKYEGEIPMDAIKEIVGDGNATITISNSQSDKNFGNGVETFMSVTLTCNQDKKTIDLAIKLANDLITRDLSNLHSTGIEEWARHGDMNKELMKG